MSVLPRVGRAVDPHLLLLFVLSALALSPLVAPGYFYSAHDGRHSVFFLTMFDEAIRDGALWPRWAMHHSQGYGYPTFVIQAPVAFYVAELFVLLGAGVTNAVKLGWALGVFAGAWGVYALVRHWMTNWPDVSRAEEAPTSQGNYASLAGLVAGLLYTYAPYHLLDIYVRAAFAEGMLFAWLPWAVLAFDRLIAGGAKPGWPGRLFWAAVAYAGLLLTHVFALIAITPLLVGFVVFRLWVVWRIERRQPGRLLRTLALAATGGVAALLLAAIFVLPLLAEGPLLAQEDFTRDTYDYARHFVHWGQFLSPFWGYGYSDDPSGANDGMGFQLGLMHVLLALAGLGLVVKRAGLDGAGREADRSGDSALRAESTRALLRFLLAATAVTLFVMTPAAASFWRSASILEVVQFPWRLLILSTFTLSVMGGLVSGELARASMLFRPDETSAGLPVVALLVVAAGLPYSRPAAWQPIEPWREDGRAVFEFEREHPDMLGYTRLVEERFTESPLTAQYLADDFSNDKLERLGILAGKGEVLRHYSHGHSFGGEVLLASAGTVQVRLLHFPGWQVRVDGQPVTHRVSPPYGLIEFDLPAGRHHIDVRMGGTPVRTTGALISGITLAALIGLWFFSRGEHGTQRGR